MSRPQIACFHVNVGGYARAFARPAGLAGRIAFLLRGWRPFNAHWWSKPNAKQAALVRMSGW
jgi:hypothetical protein